MLPPRNQRFAITIIIFVSVLSFISQQNSWAGAKQGEGHDLPPASSIRVGIKKRMNDRTTRVKAGDRIAVHYVGTLYKDEKEFDSSRQR